MKYMDSEPEYQVQHILAVCVAVSPTFFGSAPKP